MRSEEPIIAFLGTYSPRECGMATYLQDLVYEMDRQSRQSSKIIAMDEPGATRAYPPNVAWRIRQRKRADYLKVAIEVGRSDVAIVCVQHDFALFWNHPKEEGGTIVRLPNLEKEEKPDDGEALLDFLRAVQQPVVTTLHTVQPGPSSSRREMVREIDALSAGIITVSRSAMRILHGDYGISTRRIAYIPHGIPSVVRSTGAGRAAKERLGCDGRAVLLTLGFVHPDKGIEYVIEALPMLVERHPEILYLVAGPTHTLAQRYWGNDYWGNGYRQHLQRLVDDLHLHDHVRFDNFFLQQSVVADYFLAADMCLVPYLDPDQNTSGALSYALGYGKATIATPFSYAQEMLAEGCGLIVAFRSAEGIRDAVEQVLTNSELKAALERNAFASTRHMRWPRIAATHKQLFLRYVRSAPCTDP